MNDEIDIEHVVKTIQKNILTSKIIKPSNSITNPKTPSNKSRKETFQFQKAEAILDSYTQKTYANMSETSTFILVYF